ncbi:MAG: ZIP family metal transporter [Planctomycetota bacterium JB042]
MTESLAILFVALAGGLLPLLVKWSDRLLHAALALSTGIFLGAVFLHLLPALSAFEVGAHPATDAAGGHGHAHGHSLVWICVLIGVLAVYFIEALVFRTHDHDDLHRHRAVGYAALTGLSIHAFTAGMSFPLVTGANASLEVPFLVALLAHKGFEAFSLTTVFLLAEFSRRRIVTLMVLFAFVTPAGMLLGAALAERLGPHAEAIVTALAAGTFLYVCLCELLPEVFHHREDGFAKIGLLAGGIGLMALFHGAGA